MVRKLEERGRLGRSGFTSEASENRRTNGWVLLSVSTFLHDDRNRIRFLNAALYSTDTKTKIMSF